jgi:molybdopterin-guanine dinucleotide biosynthesis protein A
MEPERTAKTPPCTVAILAGGRSRRFGSDKALARLDGRTLLDIVLGRFRGRFPELLLVVDQLDRFPVAPDVRVVADRFTDCGPLGAVHAALEEAAHPLVACCTVDAPFVEPPLLARLASALDGGAAAAFFVRDGFRHPFPCLLVRDACRGPARAILQRHVAVAGGRPPGALAPKVLDLFDAVALAPVPAPAPSSSTTDPLADVDVPDDLARLGGKPE